MVEPDSGYVTKRSLSDSKGAWAWGLSALLGDWVSRLGDSQHPLVTGLAEEPQEGFSKDKTRNGVD